MMLEVLVYCDVFSREDTKQQIVVLYSLQSHFSLISCKLIYLLKILERFVPKEKLKDCVNRNRNWDTLDHTSPVR